MEEQDEDDTVPAVMNAPIWVWMLQMSTSKGLTPHEVMFTDRAVATEMALNLDEHSARAEATHVVRVQVTPRAGRASCWYAYSGQLEQYESWSGSYHVDCRRIEEFHASVGRAKLTQDERDALGLKAPFPEPPLGWQNPHIHRPHLRPRGRVAQW
jgi:hypothetical protein